MRKYLAVAFAAALGFAGVACDNGDDAQPSEEEEETVVVEDEDGDENGNGNGNGNGDGMAPAEAAAFCDQLDTMDAALGEDVWPTAQEWQSIVDAAPPELRAAFETMAAGAVQYGDVFEFFENMTPDEEAAYLQILEWGLSTCAWEEGLDG